MSMITKCPSCGTAFRVTPQQLQAQHGMVRCGRCATVFDGFKTLATQRDESPPEALTAAAGPFQPRVLDVTAPQPADVAAPASRELPGATQEREPAAEESVPPVVAPESPVPPQPPAIEPVPQATPAGTTYEIERPRRRSAGLAFGIFLLLIALAAQGIYVYRGEIAANMPETRPYLNMMCAQLRCTVALPQRPQQIKIAASDIQATDPANPGLIVVTATLRSEAAIALGYPALDVVLTNAKDHTVARRIFLPSEYLDASKDVRAGISPNAEITVTLNIDSGDLGAAGFRLDVLAAPTP